MSKSRIRSHERETRRALDVKSKAQLQESEVVRFVGVSLSGGKADKACVVVLDYYPSAQKIFLSKMIEKIKAEEFISADLKIHEILTQYLDQTAGIAFDVPLSLPKCMTCVLACPGYETCNEAEIKWMRNHYHHNMEKKKLKKLFTPYTQRCADAFLTTIEDENLEVQHALGANLAPLTARGIFIQRRLKTHILEVFPKMTAWRLGEHLKINKSQLRSIRHSVGGDDARRSFLNQLSDKMGLFIYQQDFKSMIDNHHAFEALLCALTALFKYQGRTEKKPKDFPKKEGWVEIPSL